MIEIYMPLLWEGSEASAHLRARQKRQGQMESWVGVPEIGTKWIPLGNYKMSIIDECEFEYLNQWNWHLNSTGYAVTFFGRHVVSMHSLIVYVPPKMQCDHINRNRIDNRRINLRPCTRVQNQGNRWKSKHAKTSKFKGVYFCKRRKKFSAFGREGEKNKNLGEYFNEKDAALAYNEWAKTYYGDFALLNPV